MMLSLDLGSFVVGVLATLGVLTAWVNRPSREPDRRARCRRSPSTEAMLASQAEARRRVDAAMARFAESAPQPEHVRLQPGWWTLTDPERPYDGDRDGWS